MSNTQAYLLKIEKACGWDDEFYGTVAGVDIRLCADGLSRWFELPTPPPPCIWLIVSNRNLGMHSYRFSVEFPPPCFGVNYRVDGSRMHHVDWRLGCMMRACDYRFGSPFWAKLQYEE